MIMTRRIKQILPGFTAPGKWTTTISNNWTETADQIYTVDLIFTVIKDADFYVVGFSTDQQKLHQKRIENDMVSSPKFQAGIILEWIQNNTIHSCCTLFLIF